MKEKLLSGKVVLGTWTILNSPQHCEVMAEAGLDFQILDFEHGTFDLLTLDNCIRACEIAKCSPLIRPSSLCNSQIQSALDLGVHGIVVPQVKSSSDVEELLAQTNFYPNGRRGFNPFTRAGSYYPNTKESTPPPKFSHGFNLNSVIIENESSIENLDKILKVPGLDMVYLGVYDLSVSLGCPGDVNNPKIKDFINVTVPKIRSANKYAGLMVKSESEMKEFIDLGATFLVYGVDTFILSRAIHTAVNELTRALK